MICPYCKHEAKLVGGLEVYPRRQDLADKKLYLCRPCDAYVGCHGGTENPLGRLANAELRKAKIAAHAAFDPLWKSKAMSRASAYKRLAAELGVNPADCHIGMFDVDMCNKVVLACLDIK